MGLLFFVVLAAIGLIILLRKAKEEDVKNALLNAIFNFVSMMMALVIAAYYADIGGKLDSINKGIGGKIDKVTEKMSEVGERLAIIETRLARIDSIDDRIADLKTGIGMINTKLDVLVEGHYHESAREESYNTMYAQATPEEQQKLWKAKPLFDIEYARLLKQHGNTEAVKKELPDLKQKLLNLDNEKERSTPDNGSKPNAPERSIEKLPLPPK